jgi:hypothetical protein
MNGGDGGGDVFGVANAEFEEVGKIRPCLGCIEVPIEAIDGTPSVGAVLEVRGKGDAFGGKNVRVRADQLAVALQSLAMLTPMPMLPPHPHFPPMPSPFPRGRRPPIP